jgi:hypothetical protein
MPTLTSCPLLRLCPACAAAPVKNPIELPAPGPSNDPPPPKPGQEKGSGAGGFQVGKSLGLEDYVLNYASDDDE